MQVSDKAIKAIQKVITGDQLTNGEPISPYQTGPELVDFFNYFGFEDSYSWGGGFPARWHYCEDCLKKLNGSDELGEVIEAAVDPRRFLDTDFDVAAAAEYLNDYLKYDGFTIREHGLKYRIIPLSEELVSLETEMTSHDPISRDFMREQLQKCTRKLEEKDYDGAITNARALVESVLLELESRLTSTPETYAGKLPRLYKRVRGLLHLDPKDEKVDELLHPIVTGLTSIVGGLSGLRNQLSDAHARKYRTHRHHARLAVNAAHTLVDFLLDSYEYQYTQTDGYKDISSGENGQPGE